MLYSAYLYQGTILDNHTIATQDVLITAAITIHFSERCFKAITDKTIPPYNFYPGLNRLVDNIVCK